MRKLSLAVLLISCLFLITACTENANLIIDNDTGVPTDVRVGNEFHTIPAGESKIFTWSLSSSVFGVEEKTVDVVIFRNNTKIGDFSVRVKAGSSVTRRLAENIDLLFGELKVHNNTTHLTEIRIINQDFALQANQTRSFVWEFDRPGQTNINGSIYERLFLFGRNFSEAIVAGQTKNMTIVNDAAGLEIKNNSHAFTITEVYISPSDSPTWGNNKLTGVIGPQSNSLWNLTPGTWDILIIDNWNDEFVAFDEVFTIGKLNSYNYTGFRRVENARQMKAEKSVGETRNEYRVSLIQ